ncbi:DUF4262 domain-containing protein [Streptomyces sp. NPDC093991]|uniref:DUF4262 domain-containing protein n=1 Tax=unclassified Streptomyces TaxID=2593676 RepID=UPI0034185680
MSESGWHVMGVGAGDDAPGDWAYSIGLWHTLRSPEVCMFGLRVETMMPILNVAGGEIRNGRPLEAGQVRDDILTGCPVTVRPVHPSWYRDFFGAGIDYYQAPPLPVAQLFWPDREGRFPWDGQAEEYCRASQPLLWIPKGKPADRGLVPAAAEVRSVDVRCGCQAGRGTMFTAR